MRNLILHNWLAKILAFLLAITLWTVIKKNVETTSRINPTNPPSPLNRDGRSDNSHEPLDDDPLASTPAPSSDLGAHKNPKPPKQHQKPTPSKPHEK